MDGTFDKVRGNRIDAPIDFQHRHHLRSNPCWEKQHPENRSQQYSPNPGKPAPENGGRKYHVPYKLRHLIAAIPILFITIGVFVDTG
jgi:hypothetical protein